jgi:hypothetical protein
VSPETQAAYAVRQQLANLRNGVPLSIWYDWKNDGEDPKENEHNFGTVRPELQPKPAYLAIQKLTRELGGYHMATPLQLTDHDDFALLMINEERDRKLVAWTAAKPHTATVNVPLEKELSLALELSAMPQYVDLGKPKRDEKPATD